MSPDTYIFTLVLDINNCYSQSSPLPKFPDCLLPLKLQCLVQCSIPAPRVVPGTEEALSKKWTKAGFLGKKPKCSTHLTSRVIMTQCKEKPTALNQGVLLSFTNLNCNGTGSTSSLRTSNSPSQSPNRKAMNEYCLIHNSHRFVKNLTNFNTSDIGVMPFYIDNSV